MLYLKVTIETQDRRKNNLAFKVNVYSMKGEVLVDVRLSKVCCIITRY